MCSRSITSMGIYRMEMNRSMNGGGGLQPFLSVCTGNIRCRDAREFGGMTGDMKRETCPGISGNSFAGSPQNMTDAQRNADINEICSELKDFSVNQAVTSPNAINSYTRRAEARLHDLVVEIESRYPGDGQKQQEEFQKQMEPASREELRSRVIREALSGRHTMINRGYLEKSEVYQDIEESWRNISVCSRSIISMGTCRTGMNNHH